LFCKKSGTVGIAETGSECPYRPSQLHEAYDPLAIGTLAAD
jgi:hypothetical protein